MFKLKIKGDKKAKSRKMIGWNNNIPNILRDSPKK
jgi:hypothetical protein